MDIPNSLFNFVKEEAKKVHHGRIIIELNETNDKIDVITENRERFKKEQEHRKEFDKKGELRKG